MSLPWLSYIYWLIHFKRNWHSQNFDWISLKNLSPCQFLRSSNSRRYYWNLKLLVATDKSEVWEQNCEWLFYFFVNLKGAMIRIFCLTEISTFDKNEMESKMKILRCLMWGSVGSFSKRTPEVNLGAQQTSKIVNIATIVIGSQPFCTVAKPFNLRYL